MMRRTTTSNYSSYPLKKYPSMEIPDRCDHLLVGPNNNNMMIKKSSSSIQFPTSPQLLFGEEIIHFNHRQHPLSRINVPDLFTCSGCQEYGSGKRFSCQQCDFQLHEFCALAPPALKAHPFHPQHQLLFFSKPVKGGLLKSKCEVCGEATKGYNFRCNECGFQIHPCCAMLSNEINISIHPHTLKLLPSGAGGGVFVMNGNGDSSSSSSSSGGFACRECNRRRSGRIYRCTVCDYYLHAVCAKDMINGLQANGIKGGGPGKRPSILGTAVKLASQAVMEFIGGIMEGLGESVGQAFISTVARGNDHLPRTYG